MTHRFTYSSKRLTAIAFAAMLTAFAAMADKPETVTGVGKYYGGEYDSPHKCKAEALEQARADALARKFGASVEENTYQHNTHTGNGESTYFDSQARRHVKGEWITDTKVDYDVSLDNDNHLVVVCRVTGQARSSKNEGVEFETQILRNGTDSKYTDHNFNNGDKLYVSFRAPADGYVTIYLADDTAQAFNILPYNNTDEQSVKVKRDTDYIFFSKAHAQTAESPVDEMRLTTRQDVERDELIVIFSPNYFSKPMDKFVSAKTPRMLSVHDLNKWIETARRNDKKMNVKRIPITIMNKN